LTVLSARGNPSVTIETLPGLLDGLQFDMCIIDPLYRVYPPQFDENSNSQVASLFARLQELAEGHQAAVVTVHHLAKGGQDLKAVRDLGAGAGAMARSADAHVGIREHAEDGCAVLAGVLRSLPSFDAFGIRRDHPLWARDDGLDPERLRRPGSDAGQAKKTLSPLSFAVKYVGTKRRTRAEILLDATNDMPDRTAQRLLMAAIDGRHLKKIRDDKDRRNFWFEISDAGEKT